jgi:hypothetical protein
VPKQAKTERHGFSRSNARKWGVKEAVVLRFLAYHIRKSKNEREGRRWYYNPISALKLRYPYIPRSTLADILKRAREQKLVITGSFNKYLYDRTCWYSMDQNIMDAVEEDPIYFDSLTAQRVGILGAVLISNLEKNLAERDTEDSEIPYQRMTPSILAKILPFSRKSLERAIVKLRTQKLIVQKCSGSAFYTLPGYLHPATPESDHATSESDATTSKPDKSTSKPDDDTLCKPLENTIVKDLSKEAQAEPDLLEIEDVATFLRS